jgi:hypothetical protein
VDGDASGEPIMISMKIEDLIVPIAPAIISLPIVEVHQPDPFGNAA